MKKFYILLFVLIFSAVCAFSVFSAGERWGKITIMDDLVGGSWGPITALSVASGYDSTGTFTNGVYTNYYRMSGTNLKGRIQSSSNVVFTFTGNTNGLGAGTNVVKLTWPEWGGVYTYVVERSLDGGSTWTQWVSIAAGTTTWTDYGTNTWTGGAFTGLYSLIAGPVIRDVTVTNAVYYGDGSGITNVSAGITTNSADTRYVNVSGDTMTGALTNSLSLVLRGNSTTTSKSIHLKTQAGTNERFFYNSAGEPYWATNESVGGSQIWTAGNSDFVNVTGDTMTATLTITNGDLNIWGNIWGMSDNSEFIISKRMSTNDFNGFKLYTGNVDKWQIGLRPTLDDLHIYEETTQEVTRIIVKKGTGYVGILTTNPVSALDVGGTATVERLVVSGGGDDITINTTQLEFNGNDRLDLEQLELKGGDWIVSAGDLHPGADVTYDLGLKSGSGNRWRHAYVSNVTAYGTATAKTSKAEHFFCTFNSESGTDTLAIGGTNNTVSGNFSMVGAGKGNSVYGANSVVVGGFMNSASNTLVGGNALVGGQLNNIKSYFSFLGGGYGNNISDTSLYNVMGCGFFLTIKGSGYNGIFSGNMNSITGGVSTAFIGGGSNNKNNGSTGGAIVGGANNRLDSAANGFIGGGTANDVDGSHSVIVGGLFNEAPGDYAVVGGGSFNDADGDYATAPGGRNCAADGDYSFAAGRQAKANHNGSFVWADSQASDFSTSSTNVFIVRAQGGVGINDATPSVDLDVNGVIQASEYTISDVYSKTNQVTTTSGAVTQNVATISLNTRRIYHVETRTAGQTATGSAGGSCGFSGTYQVDSAGAITQVGKTTTNHEVWVNSSYSGDLITNGTNIFVQVVSTGSMNWVTIPILISN